MGDPNLPDRIEGVPDSPDLVEGGKVEAYRRRGYEQPPFDNPAALDSFMAFVKDEINPRDPFFDKLSPEQLAKIIENEAESDKRLHERFIKETDTNSVNFRWFMASATLIILGLSYIFVSHGNADQFREIIALFLGLGAGGAGAYGYGYHKGRQQADHP